MSRFGKAIPYSIVIKPSANKGFIVQCGCAELVFGTKEALLSLLKEFLEYPQELEGEYNKTVDGEMIQEDPMEEPIEAPLRNRR